MAGTLLAYKLLQNTGGLQDIQDVIASSDDYADVVRATYGALIKTMSIPMHQWEVKSADVSNNHRLQGNIFYGNKDYEAALGYYNKALAYAPKNSIEVQLAHGNCSAVTFALKAYQATLDHINACFALGYPQHLREKLEKRKETARRLIDSESTSESNPLKQIEFNVERNAEVPCISNDIEFLDIDGSKKVVAAREIASGTLVALERAFMSTLTDDKQYTSCYYCHKITLFLVPCESCCKALFCSEDCRKICFEEYHRIECHIVGYMGTMYVDPLDKLSIRTAIKISLKLSWKELMNASKDIGENRFQNSSIKSAFDLNDSLSILSYIDQRALIQEKKFNGSFSSAAAIYCLGLIPKYFPKGGKARNEATDAITRIMLKLYATFPDCINIDCSAYNYFSKANETKQRNFGWFSFTSKLRHSCEPNLVVLGLNDHVGLVAARTIKKGEELTIRVEKYQSKLFY